MRKILLLVIMLTALALVACAPAATSTPTRPPASATPVPPTEQPTEQAAAVEPTTEPTEVPPTATEVPPTATEVPPTSTPVPPTNTPAPTNTPVPPTNTPAPTNTPKPTDTPAPTNTPTPTPIPPLKGINAVYTLAKRVPSAAPLFVAFRTDDGFIGETNTLLATVNARIPNLLPPGITFNNLLDMISVPLGEEDGTGNFKTVFRAWLGDSAAVYIPSADPILAQAMGGGSSGSDSGVPVIIAFSVTNRDAAEAFLDQVAARAGTDAYKKTEGEISTLWTPASKFASAYMLYDDVMLVTAQGGDTKPLTARVTKSLADNPAFMAAVDKLPVENYNIVAYADIAGVLRPFASFLPMMMGSAAKDINFDALLKAIGPEVIGLTVLDGRSLTIDAVQVVNGSSADVKGVNVDFLRHIPADAPLVMQGSGFGPKVSGMLDAIVMISNILEAQGVAPLDPGPNAPKEMRDWLKSIRIKDLVTFQRLSFKGMTGLDLDKDVLAWMSGDFAQYLRALPLGENGVTLDTAAVFEATDPAAARNVIDKLTAMFEQHRFGFTVEDGTLVLPGLIRGVLALALPPDVVASPEFDFLIGSNDEVFALGTRPGVEFALKPADGGLPSAAAFKEAQQYFLPNPQSIWYLNTAPLIELLDQFAPQMLANASRSDLRQFEQVRALVGLFSTGSITSTTFEDGSLGVRFVLTVAEEPLPPMPEMAATEEAMPTMMVVTMTPAPLIREATPTPTPKS